MQRFTTQLNNTSDIQKQSLHSAYEALLKYKYELSHSPIFTYRKFIELEELQRSLNDIQSVLAEIDSQTLPVILEKFKKFLSDRWSRIKSKTDNTYPYTSDSPQTQLCLTVAQILHAELPDQYPSVYQLLIPSLVLIKGLDDMPLGTFILDEAGSYLLSLSILQSYCQEIILLRYRTSTLAINHPYKSTLISKVDFDRLINCTKESTWLYQSAHAYADLLNQAESYALNQALQRLKSGLQLEKQDEEVSVETYYAIIHFSEFLNGLLPDTSNKLLSLRSNKINALETIWANLSKKGGVCVKDSASDIATILEYPENRNFASEVSKADLEEAEFNYQQYLKLFNQNQVTASFMWSKNFRVDHHALLLELTQLIEQTNLMGQLMISPTVAAYVQTLSKNRELVKKMVASQLQEWITFLQTSGLPASDIQSALMNIIGEIQFDKTVGQTMLSLGGDLLTLYNYAKSHSRNDMLDVLYHLQPDYNAWITLLRKGLKKENEIAVVMIQLIQNAGDQSAYCQAILTSGFSMLELYNKAVEHKNHNIIKLLSRLTPDYFNQNFNGKDGYIGPLMHACISLNNFDIVKILIKEGVKTDIRDAKGDTLLTYAAKNCNSHNKFAELVTLCPNLINTPNSAAETPLSIAVVNNNREKIEVLFSASCDLNVKNTQGLTTLDLACKYKHSRIARWLVEKGAQCNMQEITTKYIHDFIKAGGSKDNVVKEFIKHNINLSGCDEEGNTPLMNAVLYGSVELVKLLLEKSPDVLYIKNKQGNSPLDITSRPDKIALLRSAENTLKKQIAEDYQKKEKTSTARWGSIFMAAPTSTQPQNEKQSATTSTQSFLQPH